MIKHNLIALGLMVSSMAAYADDSARVEELEQRISELEASFEERINLLADELENTQQTQTEKRVHFGGYGEMHYRHLDDNGEDIRELDFHRWVFFIGYDFNESMRFISEFELEHTVSPGSEGNGAVELEQAYLEFDLTKGLQIKSGIMLTPVGIINETHEPPTFYGVERPVVETTIIPTTWFVGGVMLSQQFSSGFSYDLMISEGFKTDETDPFNLKGGKQKTSFADAFDLATTLRVTYRAPGIELAAYGQYQPDIDQSARDSYADAATLLGGHVIYQFSDVTIKALYASWFLAGDAAADAERDLQAGGYLELSYRPAGAYWGVFTRQSSWRQEADIRATQIDVGASYFPTDNIVFKLDYQAQNDEANNPDAIDGDGFNLGMGYQF